MGERNLPWYRLLFVLPLLWLIRGYQRLLSPLLPSACRFHPTCSEYAHRALSRHGLWRGVWLASSRVIRCNPWNEGGEDPVP